MEGSLTKDSAPGLIKKGAAGRRVAVWLIGFFIFFGLFGYFGAPPLIKSILLEQASKALHREVAIERIEINPYALSARVTGLSIKADGGKEQVGLDELFVNLSTASLFKFAVIADELRLDGLRIAVARVAEGRYDISDLLDEWMKPKEEPPGETPRFSANNIRLSNARLEFDDQPKGKLHRIDEINLTLPFVSSLPYQAEILVEPSFSAIINGSPLNLKGRSKPFAGRHESELDLDLDRLDLAGLRAYIPDSIPLRLDSGMLDTELKIVFKEVADKVFSLSVVGAAHVSGLKLAERGGAPLVGWKRLDIDLESADLINRRIALKKVGLDGLDATLSVNRKGEFNILLLADQLGKSGTSPATAAPAGEKPAALSWSLEGFSLTNGLIRWSDESNLTPVSGEVRRLQAQVGKVDSRLVEPIEVREVSYQIDLGERFRVDQMLIRGMKIDLPAHRIDIAEVSNRDTAARMFRNKAGKVEWVSSPLLKTIRATDAKIEDRPWIGKVEKVSVENLNFRIEDQATSPAAVQELEGFNLRAANLGNGPGQRGTIALNGKVNKKGRLNVSGDVQLLPLDLALKLETVAIPVIPLQPYFSEYMNVALARGQVSNKGEATAKIDDGGLNAAYKGSVTFGDFLAVDRENSADFLKWKSLFLGGIDFRLAPMAIQVGEIALTDFYSRLILSQAGRLNVQDIVRKQKPVEPDPSVPAAQALPGTNTAKPPLPIKIAKITLQNGTVNFSDFFVKPNYTVNLTKLGGRVTNLSSAADTVADLDLRGIYANAAPVQIVGRLNPLAAQSFLDVKAEVNGIDLVALSPYSGKYAGYNIEKGKLSVNVDYKLENRKLSAENRLFIDQLTFGDKVESPHATNLPVNLAISLLRNNRGEIDVNLPISGSLDDPQFSVGGLIVQVLVNLVVKAVSSPFALLGSLVGGGEELSNIEFAAGRDVIDVAGSGKLTSLAKALNERSGLKLDISGRADPEIDTEGIRRVALERAVKAEKMKDVVKNGGEGSALDGLEISPADYPVYLNRAYKEARFPKPRNAIGLTKDLPVEEMEKLMLANIRVGEADVAQLARTRAENVQLWLIEKGGVPTERLFLVPPKLGGDGKGKASRVDFSLR